MQQLLAALSKITSYVKGYASEVPSTLAFGGLNVILVGDFHQFPPVGNPSAALYSSEDGSAVSALGRAIYLQFETVVKLTEQCRITDPVWNQVLANCRVGECTEDDLNQIGDLVLTNEKCQTPDFDTKPWSDAILVTSQHGVRVAWNEYALLKHRQLSGQTVYVCPSEDTIAKDESSLTLAQKIIVAGMKEKQTGRLQERMQISVGMKAMVVLNIATEADLANGTRGEIVDLVLDPREDPQTVKEEGCRCHLQYPPRMVLFKPYTETELQLEGVPKGQIPIFPSEAKFSIREQNGAPVKVCRRQLAITAGYAFTDYKSQGQTIEHVIVDLGKPPSGALSPFSAYVALSRSRGRNNIRLLRHFDDALFTRHPSEDLRDEDERLARLDAQTAARFGDRR